MPVKGINVLRYCGNLQIRVRLTVKDQYVCTVRPISMQGAIAYTVTVNPPASPDRAIDSTEAMTGAAHAALSFLSDEGHPIDVYAAHKEDGSGWDVRTSKPAYMRRKVYT